MPKWDLTSAFPDLESAEFQRAFEEAVSMTGELEQKLDSAESISLEDNGALRAALEDLIEFYNRLNSGIRTLSSFIHGFVSVDSRDLAALAKESELDEALIPFSKAGTRFTAWIGKLPLESLFEGSRLIQDHEFVLRKSQIAATHQMSPEEESLAAELYPSAASAWSKLHGQLTSQIEVELEQGGKTRKLPMSMVRNLAYDPDRNVRKTAYEAELAAWQANETSLAAAMNGIKGTVTTLSRRRGWDSPLDEALFGANIDRETLDAMMSAARESFPDFRRYLQAKAKLFGVSRLAFFDIFAPAGVKGKAWTYEEAAEFVSANFHCFSEKLGAFADRSVRENWIDAEPKAGKRDGAFCMWLVGDESRVLMNFKPSFGSVKTLAHELGHAYHNLCLANRTLLQRRTPMTLAETASIFCETVIQNAALKEAGDEEGLVILEGALCGACQVTVDITSRFLFERDVFDGRAKRELSGKEFCSLMVNAQKETYGDGLDEDFLHPYMWAAKTHYYGGRSFYNFPYMYGMLFGLGLYSRYLEDAEKFKISYDDLLSSTGMADAASLADRFGFNVRGIDFWRSSFDVIRTQIAQFEARVDSVR